MLPRFSRPHAILTLAAAALLAGVAAADWVWTPERGWHNPKTEVRGSADELFKTGTRLYQSKKYDEAADVFTSLADGFPGSRYAKRAEFYAGESYFEAGKLFEAYQSYEAYLRDYPESAEIETIVEKEYEIGRAYLNGARKPTFGMSFLSLPSPKTGLAILESVITHSPYSDFADDALYTIAEYHFRDGQYDVAAESYRRLTREYPESEWATKSKYQAAQCAERSFTGGAYSVESLVAARKQLEEYEAQNPGVTGGPSVAGQIEAIDESLAEKLWSEVAFYERVGKPHSAGYMCRRLQARYPDTRYAALAEQWIADHPDVLAERADEADETAEVLASPLAAEPRPAAPPAPAPVPASSRLEPIPPEPGAPRPASTQPAGLQPAAPQPASGGRFVPRSHSTSGSR